MLEIWLILFRLTIRNSRRKSIGTLDINNGDIVHIIGAGTGLDLEFSPNECEIIATDNTSSMLEKLKIESSK